MALALARKADGAPASSSECWGGVQRMLCKLGAIASTQRGRKVGGKQKRVVRFAVHDLSCLAPPKVSNPGSEAEQDVLIEDLVSLLRMQRELLPPPPTTTTDGAPEGGAGGEDARRALGGLRDALAALAGAEALPPDMRTSAGFYAGEVARWLADPTAPMLVRRAAELLSSSLRLHLAAVLSEEEGQETHDPTLTAIHARVAALATAYGFSVPTGEEAAEHFAALVTYSLKDLHEHAPLLAEGTAVRDSLLALHAKKEAAAAAAACRGGGSCRRRGGRGGGAAATSRPIRRRRCSRGRRRRRCSRRSLARTSRRWTS